MPSWSRLEDSGTCSQDQIWAVGVHRLPVHTPAPVPHTPVRLEPLLWPLGADGHSAAMFIPPPGAFHPSPSSGSLCNCH